MKRPALRCSRTNSPRSTTQHSPRGAIAPLCPLRSGDAFAYLERVRERTLESLAGATPASDAIVELVHPPRTPTPRDDPPDGPAGPGRVGARPARSRRRGHAGDCRRRWAGDGRFRGRHIRSRSGPGWLRLRQRATEARSRGHAVPARSHPGPQRRMAGLHRPGWLPARGPLDRRRPRLARRRGGHGAGRLDGRRRVASREPRAARSASPGRSPQCP